MREAHAARSKANGAPASEGAPYEADAGHLYYVRLRPTDAGWEVERTVICDFSAEITEEATAESGERSYTIAGETADGRPIRLEMPAERFADARRLQAALGAKLAYRISPEADLQQGLTALADLVEAPDPRRTIVALTGLFVGPLAAPAGWDGERFAQCLVGPTSSLKTSHMQTGMCISSATS